MADITDSALRVLLEHNTQSFQYEGDWWTRTKPQDRAQYGDGFFRNTPAARAEWKSTYNKQHGTPQGAPHVSAGAGQKTIDTMPQEEYKHLTTPSSQTAGWNPPRLIMVPLASLVDDKDGIDTVMHNMASGWKVVAVVMARG
jgi:hypothetical protein